MEYSKRKFDLKAAYVARVLQNHARQHNASVSAKFPNDADMIEKTNAVIRKSEELVHDIDRDVFTPEQISNFDL